MFIRASDLHEFMSDDEESEEIVSKGRGRPRVQESWTRIIFIDNYDCENI